MATTSPSICINYALYGVEYPVDIHLLGDKGRRDEDIVARYLRQDASVLHLRRRPATTRTGMPVRRKVKCAGPSLAPR